MSQAPQVYRETGVLQEALVLDLRDPQERKASRASQEDPEVPVHPVGKENRAWRWLRKAYQEPEDWTARRDCPAHQVARVSPDRMVSLVHQERRGILDSTASDSQDPQEAKDSQVPTASQDLLQDQVDRESMDSLASLDFLDPRVSLALAFLALQVYQEYMDLKVSSAQKETLASLAAPVHLDDLDLMDLRDLKVIPVHLVYPELVAHLDPSPAAHWGSQDHLDPLAQWDHQDFPDQTEGRETPALQV